MFRNPIDHNIEILLHIGRDTPWGCALRSHFFMGQDLPAGDLPAAEVAEALPDAFATALLQHCYNEFTFLSRFLPSLYIAENRADAHSYPNDNDVAVLEQAFVLAPQLGTVRFNLAQALLEHDRKAESRKREFPKCLARPALKLMRHLVSHNVL